MSARHEAPVTKRAPVTSKTILVLLVQFLKVVSRLHGIVKPETRVAKVPNKGTYSCFVLVVTYCNDHRHVCHRSRDTRCRRITSLLDVTRVKTLKLHCRGRHSLIWRAREG